jgi:hypothetical protein
MAVYENVTSLCDAVEDVLAGAMPVSGMKRKPRVGSVLAASSMAWAMVRDQESIVEAGSYHRLAWVP